MSKAALCSSAFSMFFVLFSVFPYGGFMVIHLVPNHVTVENVGLYAGFLASAFMAGRACAPFGWGRIADIYGRKFVLFLAW